MDGVVEILCLVLTRRRHYFAPKQKQYSYDIITKFILLD